MGIDKQGTLYEREIPEDIFGQISLKFDGKAAKDHTLDLEQYATSLLGFSKILKKSIKSIYGMDIKIKIEAEKEGSVDSFLNFLIENQQHAAVINTYIDLFENVAGVLLSAGTCVFLTIKKLIALIKKSKGKRQKLEQLIDELGLNDEKTRNLLKLLKNGNFRKGLDKLTKFLEKLDMDKLVLSDQNENKVEIYRAERPYFVEFPEDIHETKISEETVAIIYPSAERTKWRFVIKGRELWVEVNDYSFLDATKNYPLEYFEGKKFVATYKHEKIIRAATGEQEVYRSVSNIIEYTPQVNLQLPIDKE